MIKTKIGRDILYSGLPAIWFKDGYVVYSPYVKKFVRLEEHQIYDIKIGQELNRIGFFPKFPEAISYNETKEGKIVVLTITKKCNLKCAYCFADASPTADNLMSPYVATNIIEKMSEQDKLIAIHFVGGEPTLNFATIRSVKERADEIDLHPNYYITTNGTAPKQILNWLIDNGFIIKISWDGARSQTRSFASGLDSAARVEQTIAHLIKKRCNFCVRMTVTKSNLPYMLESIQRCAEIGVKFFQVEPMSLDGRGSNIKYEAPDPEEFINFILKVITAAENKGFWLINSALANLFDPKNYFCCSLRGQIYHFNPDGTISGCYKAMDKGGNLADKFIFGNYEVRDTQIKFNINAELFHQLIALSNGNYSSCHHCFLRFVCSGGCPFSNFKLNPEGDDINPWACQIRMGILRMGILHIYRRALKGKGSCLEGSVRFYQYLCSKREALNGSEDVNNIQTLDICV